MPSLSLRLEPDGQARPANLLLASLSADAYARIRRLLEVHPLQMRETLQEAGDSPDYVYFPTRGNISALTVLESGMMVEVATIGREGTTAVPVFLGVGDSTMAFISQLPGEALRMRSEDFLAAISGSPSLNLIMKRYSAVMLGLVSQSAACNRAHQVFQRSARWLLMTHDQTRGEPFPLTQEFLAQMLGVTRASLASSEGELQRAGLISYHRGMMTVVDRAGLERAACECYATIRDRFRRLQL